MKIKILRFIKSELFLISFIFILGTILRFYKLGTIPSGFVNDEANFGYNAYSLIKTGKDEFGSSWPLIFRSFGDGKMPIYFYLTIPFVLVFGLTEFAVRFPSALFGSLTIIVIYFLTKKLTNKKSISFLSSLVLATLPWHIHFSRAAFEANIGLFFISLATALFIYKKPLLSALVFTFSIFSYHAPRIFVPMWLVYLCIYFRKKINFKKTLTIFFLLTAIPWIVLSISGQSLNRASGITLVHQQSGIKQRLTQKFSESRNQSLLLVRALHNRPVEYLLDFSKRYFSHFDSNFLFFQGDPNRPRYRAPDMGQALWLSIPFFYIGLYFLVKNKLFLIIAWIILSPIASAITFETPSAIRSLLLITPLSITIALGLYQTFTLTKLKMLKLLFIIILLPLFIYNLAHYLDAYFVHMPVHQPYEWQGGYKELVQKLTKLMPQYDKAVITDVRGTPYIYFLFYNQYSPLKWHAQADQSITIDPKFKYYSIGQLENLHFVSKTCPANPDLWPDDTHIPEKDVLYVCTQEHHPNNLIRNGNLQIIDQINFDDGQAAFVLMAKPPKLQVPGQ